MAVGGAVARAFAREGARVFRAGRTRKSLDAVAARGDTWTWNGETTRTTATFTDNGKTQTAHHERLDDEGNWVPSMEVTLTKVE